MIRMRSLLVAVLTTFAAADIATSKGVSKTNGRRQLQQVNFRANYRGDFQSLLAGNCNGPKPELQALCVGDIELLSTSSDTIECTPITLTADLPDGFSSGLLCTNTCLDNAACETVYLNSDNIEDGPWASIFYQCEGTNIDDVDTAFAYLDSGDGDCDDSFYFDNRYFHVSRLNVFCAGRGNEGEYVNDDAFFECGGGAWPVNPYDSITQEHVCVDGRNCGAAPCVVDFDTTYVNADVHRFQTECVQQLNDTVPIPPPQVPDFENDLPTGGGGTFTARFKAGYGLLFKESFYWYDAVADCSGQWPTVRITCNNGTIDYIEANAETISCTPEGVNTLVCTEVEAAGGGANFYNYFSDVTYDCHSNEFPTTSVLFEPENVTCTNLYSDRVVGLHALQLGLYCGSVLTGGDFYYNDFYFECGDMNYYHFLGPDSDEDTGNRFTCADGHLFVEGVDEGTTEVVPPVTIRTDWRYQAFPDDTCYTYEESEGSGGTTPAVVAEPAPTVAPLTQDPIVTPGTPTAADSGPTQAPTMATMPPTGPGGCYTSLDAVYFVISDDDLLFTQKTFVICPGTIMDVGFLVPGVGIDQGQAPIVPRSNTEFLCGEDGSSANNCVIRGGDFGVIAVPVFFRQDISVNNVVIKGFTFTEQVQYGAFVATAGDILFENCIFKDSANFGPMVFNYDSNLDLGRRLAAASSNPWDATYDYVQKYRDGTLPKQHRSLAENQEAMDEETDSSRELQTETFEGTLKNCIFIGLQQVERKLGVEFGIISIKTPDHVMEMVDCTFGSNQYGNQELTPIGYGILVQGSEITMDSVCFINNDFRGNGVVLLEETANPFAADADFLTGSFVTTGDDDLDCEFAAYFATDEDRRNSNFTCVPPQVTECGGEPISGTTTGGTEPTATPITLPPTSSDGCYTSLDAIYAVIANDDLLFQQKRFVVCPNTTMDIGFLVPGVGIDQGQAPLVPRSNTEFLCGEDGKSDNNCIIRGGDFGLIAVPVFFRQDLSVNNVVIRGFTFTEQVQYNAFVATAGDINFEDCVFKDTAGFGPLVFNFDSTLDLGRRWLVGAAAAEHSPWDATHEFIQMYQDGSLPTTRQRQLRKKERGQARDLQMSVFESTMKDCRFTGLQQIERKLGVEFGVVSIKTPDHIIAMENCTFSDNQYGNQELTPIGYGILVQGAEITLNGNCFLNNDFRGNGAVILELTPDPFLASNSDSLVENYATADDELDCAFAAYFATEEDRLNGLFSCVDVQTEECGGEPIVGEEEATGTGDNGGGDIGIGIGVTANGGGGGTASGPAVGDALSGGGDPGIQAVPP